MFLCALCAANPATLPIVLGQGAFNNNVKGFVHDLSREMS